MLNRCGTISNKVSISLLKNPWCFIALGFGSGLAPVAPGTFGTLAALPMITLLIYLPPLISGLVVGIGFILGVYACQYTTRVMDCHDHPAIVWDEIIGLLITLFLVPISFTTVILGFILFRAFDIVKPWPIKPIDQRVEGGFGIMIDDVVAAVFANIVLQLALSIWPGLATF